MARALDVDWGEIVEEVKVERRLTVHAVVADWGATATATVQQAVIMTRSARCEEQWKKYFAALKAHGPFQTDEELRMFVLAIPELPEDFDMSLAAKTIGLASAASHWLTEAQIAEFARMK